MYYWCKGKDVSEEAVIGWTLPTCSEKVRTWHSAGWTPRLIPAWPIRRPHLSICLALNGQITAQTHHFGRAGTPLKRAWQLGRDRELRKAAHVPFSPKDLGLWLGAALPWSMCILTTFPRSDLFLTLCFRVSAACWTQTQSKFCSQPRTGESPSFNFKRSAFSLKGKESFMHWFYGWNWQMSLFSSPLMKEDSQKPP